MMFSSFGAQRISEALGTPHPGVLKSSKVDENKGAALPKVPKEFVLR
jgi:hypothetical protein